MLVLASLLVLERNVNLEAYVIDGLLFKKLLYESLHSQHLFLFEVCVPYDSQPLCFYLDDGMQESYTITCRWNPESIYLDTFPVLQCEATRFDDVYFMESRIV